MSGTTDLELAAIDGGKPAKTTPYTRQAKFDDTELQELKEALAQGTLFYAFGNKVKSLVRAFADKLGAAHGVATSSGTASIHTALMAAGISPGDEVIVSPVTDMGSVGPILWQQAIPVFADLHPTRHTMTVDAVRAVMTEKTRAVILVHLWGNASDAHAIRQLCDERNVILIEDCAQAYGCKLNGDWVGRIGHVGCFSLNDFKHISCGDGGIVLTDDVTLARRMVLATDKGYSRESETAERNPTFLCANYRMTELQGAVGLAQIKKLDSIIERRQKWCGDLIDGLKDIPGLILPEVTPGGEASWWFFLFRIDAEKMGVGVDDFVKALNAEQVPVGAHYIGRCVYQYPIFINHSAYERGHHPYEAVDYKQGMCPQAEDLIAHCAILPINEGFTQQDLAETIEAFRKCAVWAGNRGSEHA